MSLLSVPLALVPPVPVGTVGGSTVGEGGAVGLFGFTGRKEAVALIHIQVNTKEPYFRIELYFFRLVRVKPCANENFSP